MVVCLKLAGFLRVFYKKWPQSWLPWSAPLKPVQLPIEYYVLVFPQKQFCAVGCSAAPDGEALGCRSVGCPSAQPSEAGDTGGLAAGRTVFPDRPGVVPVPSRFLKRKTVPKVSAFFGLRKPELAVCVFRGRSRRGTSLSLTCVAKPFGLWGLCQRVRVPEVCRSHTGLVVSFPWSCHVRRCEQEDCSFSSLSGVGTGGQDGREDKGGAATALWSLHTEDASVTISMRLR